MEIVDHNAAGDGKRQTLIHWTPLAFIIWHSGVLRGV